MEFEKEVNMLTTAIVKSLLKLNMYCTIAQSGDLIFEELDTGETVKVPKEQLIIYYESLRG